MSFTDSNLLISSSILNEDIIYGGKSKKLDHPPNMPKITS